MLIDCAAREEIEGVQEFCLSVGLPVTLEEIGVTIDERIRALPAAACVEGEMIHNMTGDVTPDELHDAIVLADALGRELLSAVGSCGCE